MSHDVSSETDALLEFLEAHYEDRIDTERQKALRDRIEDRREIGNTLRDYPLENGDRPAYAFRPYPDANR